MKTCPVPQTVVLFLIVSLFAPQAYAAGSSPRLVPQQTDLYGGAGITFAQDSRTVAVLGPGVTLWSARGYLLRHLSISHYPMDLYFGGPREGARREDVSFALFLKNGSEIATASKTDNAVRFYDTLSGEPTRNVSLHGEGSVGSIAVSPDESRLAIGTSKGFVETWDLKTNTFIRQIQTPSEHVSQVGFFGKGRDIVSGSLVLVSKTCSSGACTGRYAQGKVRTAISVWDPRGRLRKTIWRDIVAGYPPFSQIPGRDELGIINGDSIEILDKNLSTITSAAIPVSSGGSDGFSRILFRPDGNAVILAGKSDQKIKVEVLAYPGFSKTSEYLLGSGPGTAADIAFSPDSRLLGVAGRDGAEIVMADSGAPLNRLERKVDRLLAVAADPTGKVLASCNPVRLWDWTGAWLPNFRGYLYPGALQSSQLIVDEKSRDVIAKTAWGDIRAATLQEKMNALFSTFPQRDIKTRQLLFTDNGRYLFLNSETGNIRIMDLEGKITSTFPSVPRSPMALTHTGLFAFIWPGAHADSRGKTAVVSLKTGTTVYLLPDTSTPDIGSIDPEGKYLAWGDKIWDLPNGKVEARFNDGPLDVSFQSRTAAARGQRGNEGGTLSISDWEHHTLGSTNTASYPWVAKFIRSGEELIVGYRNGAIELRKTPGLELIKRLEGHSREVTSIAVSTDEKFLVSAGADNTINVWNLDNYQSYARITNGDEWAIYTPDGYFDASPHGGELIAMVDGLNAYPIDQFAAQRNRPDLILERMGLGTPELIGYYQSLYQKRLKNLGISGRLTGAPASVPEGKITGVKREGSFATVDFVLSDDKYQLERCLIYVNDTPVFGQYGKKISGRYYKGKEKIELTAGKNKIEISGINEAGVESYRALTYVDLKNRKGGELYYLAFGVSKYKDPELALNYADKDAKDLEGVILKMRPRYDRVHVKTLLNSEVTAANIAAAKDFLKNSKARDTVVLFLAGHGGYDKSKAPKYYYLPYEADPNDLQSTGVDYDAIESLLTDIQARKKLLLLDTCDSGELDEDTFANYYAKATARGITPRTFRKPVKGRGQAGLKVRDYLYKKDRFIYNNLSKRSGAIVLSSSRGGEISYESSAIKNGFFTKEILAALTEKLADTNDDKMISSDELKKYVSATVSEKTGGLQHPTVDRDNLFQGIDFPSLAY